MMKYSNDTVLLFIFVLIVLTFSFTGNDEFYEVTGILVNENGLAIADHEVLLFDENDEQITSGRTDSEGQFTLSYQKEPVSVEPGFDAEATYETDIPFLLPFVTPALKTTTGVIVRPDEYPFPPYSPIVRIE